MRQKAACIIPNHYSCWRLDLGMHIPFKGGVEKMDACTFYVRKLNKNANFKVLHEILGSSHLTAANFEGYCKFCKYLGQPLTFILVRELNRSHDKKRNIGNNAKKLGLVVMVLCFSLQTPC